MQQLPSKTIRPPPVKKSSEGPAFLHGKPGNYEKGRDYTCWRRAARKTDRPCLRIAAFGQAAYQQPAAPPADISTPVEKKATSPLIKKAVCSFSIKININNKL